MAQRVGRGIALVLHDCGTRRGWVVSSTPRPHFTPGKDPVPILHEAGWAPGPVWTGGKSRPRRDSIPDLPVRSSVAIPTELPGPYIKVIECYKILSCKIVYLYETWQPEQMPYPLSPSHVPPKRNILLSIPVFFSIICQLVCSAWQCVRAKRTSTSYIPCYYIGLRMQSVVWPQHLYKRSFTGPSVEIKVTREAVQSACCVNRFFDGALVCGKYKN